MSVPSVIYDRHKNKLEIINLSSEFNMVMFWLDDLEVFSGLSF